MISRFESIAQNTAIVYAEDAQQVANDYLIKKHGSLEAAPQSDTDAAAAWVAGDRNYYDLIKIGQAEAA
ncbi:hypothetical protein DN730_13315 [Marinomonas piezotolerans]|uniref:Uncharacterized protein n=1 Tax=Marinomonas piezotolerans TaxID=2213058 RepID=A0A370U7F2_9GAMM|nr:hypothetical protein [Marinomonas piezotolerans]RDL43720.1 hypothetical protein DN730_13315 [Marinomonas piezotolerans]